MSSPNGSLASETRQEVTSLPAPCTSNRRLTCSAPPDLDSLACALADAHFAREKDAARTGSKRRHVPLFLSRRTDLHLRPENLLALETAQIPVQDLLTIDDLPAARLANLGTRFSLVDHNVLLDQFRSHPESPNDPRDDARVVSILDHHVDERKHLGAEPRVIELIGSCSSLVTRQYGADAAPVPTPLADLLLSAIAIDTRMKPVADGGKAADVDLNAVETLLPFSSFFATSATTAAAASSSDSPPTAAALDVLNAYNSRLSDAKEDVAHLSGHDLLRRDYKEYHESSIRYGLSTVPLSLSTWLKRFSPPSSSLSSSDAKQAAVNELLDEVRLWMDERDLALAGVLTSYSHIKKSGTVGGRRREILIMARGGGSGDDDEQAAAAAAAAAFDLVFAGLEKDPVLELGEWKASKDYSIDRGRGGRERWQVWQQGNARATRKQVAPALKDLVHQAFGGSPERL